MRLLKIILINFFFPLIFIEIILQIAAIWVEPETIAAKFSGDKKYIRVLALGDSNTYGLFLKPYQAWPRQFENLWNTAQSEKITVLNLGYPGTNTVRVASEINEILDATKPDLVVMMLGGNDFWTASLPDNEKQKNKKINLQEYLMWLRTYKILDFFLKENIYKKDIRYAADQIFIDLPNLPKDEGIERLKKFLVERNLNVICEKATECYAKNHDKRIDILEIYNRLLSAKNTEVRVNDEHVFSGPVDSMMATMALIIISDLGYPQPTVPGEHSGDAVFYNGYQFTLGPNASTEISENIRLRMIKNYGVIKKEIDKNGAAFVILNYHNNFPINRDLKDVSLEYGIPLIDINSAINAQCNPGRCPELLFSDGHPNAAGQIFIAEQVQKFFVEHPLCEFVNFHSACH